MCRLEADFEYWCSRWIPDKLNGKPLKCYGEEEDMLASIKNAGVPCGSTVLVMNGDVSATGEGWHGQTSTSMQL